jgi:hypothetical protein
MVDVEGFRSAQDLESALRRSAPEPEFEFAMALERFLAAPAPKPRAQLPRPQARLALAATLTLALAAGLGATGSLSYAASSIAGAVRQVTASRAPIVVRGLSAGGDQYRPGFGFGDPNHNHSGPPGLKRMDKSGGSLAPPLQATPAPDGFGSVISTQINFDEQAHLYLSVVDGTGTPLLLTQRSRHGGSSVGGTLAGPQTKVIQYVVLVPRTIPISLRVPSSQLERGHTYRLRVVAVDPQGNRSVLYLPFRA